MGINVYDKIVIENRKRKNMDGEFSSIWSEICSLLKRADIKRSADIIYAFFTNIAAARPIYVASYVKYLMPADNNSAAFWKR